jgi:hypothetical protein
MTGPVLLVRPENYEKLKEYLLNAGMKLAEPSLLGGQSLGGVEIIQNKYVPLTTTKLVKGRKKRTGRFTWRRRRQKVEVPVLGWMMAGQMWNWAAPSWRDSLCLMANELSSMRPILEEPLVNESACCADCVSNYL